MELTQHYLEEVVKVHGVYTLRVPDGTTDETIHNIYKAWEAAGNTHHLFIMPQQFDMSFLNTYSLYIALMLVRAGQHVTTESWIDEVVNNETGGHPNPAIRRQHVKHKAPYIKLNEDGDLVKYFPETKEEFLFRIDDNAMDADDYILIERTRR